MSSRLLTGALLCAASAAAQVDYGTRLGEQLGDEGRYRAQGPSVLLGAVDPAMRRWYVPQELYHEYGWRQWQYTNYARDHYDRYVDIALEGDYFYDVYGDFVTRGWLIFNNAQTRPEQFGNTLFKGDRFRNWFSEVVVAADQKGQYGYALTLGSELRTTLTPMTFSKPRFDGVQFDFAADRYEATVLYSRASHSGGGTTAGLEVDRTNNTILFGGRAATQLTDFATLGFNLINSHQSNTLTDRQLGNPFSGLLTVGQNQTIGFIQIVLRDDSPDDGIAGAAFFPAGSDIILTYRDGTVERGGDIGFAPVIEGGFDRPGFVAADGQEEIRLLYDFDGPEFAQNAHAVKDSIVQVEFELVLGNDYQVWATSNRQTNERGETVLLLIDQAEGNVQDVTNLRTVRFEYGLPTATHVAGVTLEVRGWRGFDFYGEYDVNWNYRKYPNPYREVHSTSSGIEGATSNPAWMVNLARPATPLSFFVEAYSMDPGYNTATFVTRGDGTIDYESRRDGRIEFVDDNDDHDRNPDNVRFDWRSGDQIVFPGWDQNNDFIADFNQNDNYVLANTIPDFEEPFLRFSVDRPEFLFGVDMNHNFWVDPYENDEAPDYPYDRDHRGLNAYATLDVNPELRLTAGVLRENLISSDQRNDAVYGQVTFDGDHPRWGRFRLFEMSQLVEDDIPDPLLQWRPDNTVQGGVLSTVDDPLLARDTWVNQFFVGHAYEGARLRLDTKVNHTLFRQLMGDERRRELGLSSSDFFFGVINRASYRVHLGGFDFEPRWKSEYRRQSISPFREGERDELRELFGALVEKDLLDHTRFHAGVEFMLFRDFERDDQDFDSQSIAIQFSNSSEYLGYRIRALTGVVIERKDLDVGDATTTSTSFVTIYAGLR